MNISRTGQFKRDYKKMIKRGKNIGKLNKLITELSSGTILDSKYKDHILLGNYKFRRECHVEPDWLLIYKIENDEIILERTGSHSDLFE